MTDPSPRITALARECAGRGLRLRDALSLFEAVYIASVLASTGGNKAQAAEAMGIRPETLSRYHTREGA